MDQFFGLEQRVTLKLKGSADVGVMYHMGAERGRGQNDLVRRGFLFIDFFSGALSRPRRR